MLDESTFWQDPHRRLDGYSIAERIAYRSMPEPNSGCRLWLSATDSGYGVFSYKNRKVYAHRAAYELAHGPIPDGLHVCHRCDNPPCCNPDHMFLGTHLENVADMRRKGRAARGERQTNSKITRRDVLRILADVRRPSVIAAEYGISRNHVNAIKAGRVWKHITTQQEIAA